MGSVIINENCTCSRQSDMITEQLFPLQFDEFFVGHMLSGSDFMESRAPFRRFHNGCFWEFLSEKYLIQISIWVTKEYEIRKVKVLLLCQFWKLTNLCIFFQKSYSLAPKIEVCLKYFLHKNSHKQPLWIWKDFFSIW